MQEPQVLEFKILPKYDTLWAYIGLFIPVPSSYAQYTPDFAFAGWGFSSTIPVGKYKVPLGLIILILAIIL